MSGGLFTNYTDAGSKNPENPDSELYSILNQLEDYRHFEGNFQFKLCYPELKWGKDGRICNEWIQSSNPYTNSTITDFKAISIAFEKNSILSEWEGLAKNPAGINGNTVIDDSPSHGYYYSSIGAMTYWPSSGSIAGPRHPTDSSGKLSIVTKVELYLYQENLN